MSGYDFMHGDVDAMRRTADNWRQSHEEVAGRNTRLNGGNTGLEAVWKGQGGRTFQNIEPERFGQNKRLTTTGDGLADTMVTSSNKYFDTDSDNGRVLSASGGFHVDSAAISNAISA
ncbi:WXG100 family type VII secretion target [Amycolatopsis taiwanensis]|uniref:Uncharacterized protein n=1 Tax=Amycolatopsis taiwanensis TaxID=342230 RepID=A0A9W6QUW4_9PSEU|nr:WXG100 family type VII secretion target [Amycolatopsis taiwanensis]GLY64173.1 hypothetical protein Atai01_07920 [Amycolatopsis taiwanensis]